MGQRRRWTVGVTAAVLVVATPTAAGAGGGRHDDTGITTVAGGLDGPRELNEYEHGKLVVAEADSGEVSSVDRRTGEVRTLVSGLYAPQGVDYRDGKLYIAVGEAAPPDDAPGAPPPPPEGVASSALLVADTGGRILHTVDLLAHELANNPDGQVQFVDEEPVDALSNPFSVLAQRKRVLVADAGANAVLSVDRRTGEVSTFFVPPVVTPEEVPACGEEPNNPGTIGCDPVPTGVAEGPHGLIVVSTLGGAEVPGAARIYVLTPRGEVLHVIEDLDGLTGVDVDRRGTVYASAVVEGQPEGEPGPDFDPATVGQIVRIERDGTRSYAQVTMPIGLEVENGKLYASAWSVAGPFLQMPSAGEVVRVGRGSFDESTP